MLGYLIESFDTKCIKHCPMICIYLEDNNAIIDILKCIKCGHCIAICQ
ncbi:4Fe-4S dicluster domain-containing protein [Romboutsia faecis]